MQRKRPLASALLIVALLAQGCARPGPAGAIEDVNPTGPAGAAEDASPAGSATGRAKDAHPELNISSAQGTVQIAGVRPPYLWHAGGERIALAAESGLWSLRPDGSDPRLLATVDAEPLLVGPFAGGVVYLQRHPGFVDAYLARPGEPPKQLARVEHGAGGASYPVWAVVWQESLLLALEGRRLSAVDLASGDARELGDEPIPVQAGDLAFSPQEGVLAYKLANRGDSLRLLRMDGRTLRPAGEPQVAPIAWSSTGDRWAVRAAEAGSALPAVVGANLEEGGTHLTVGDASGQLTQFRPPQPLELVAGPWWSPDGAWLAVVSGTLVRDKGGADPAAGADAPRRIWVVNVEDGVWRDLGPLPEGAFTTGFHPTQPGLVVHGPAGAALWPVDGGEPQPLTPPWAAGEEPAVLPGGSLLYLGGDSRTLYLQRPGEAARLLFTSRDPLGALTAAGGHAALLRYREETAPDLLLLPLPAADG